MAQPNREVRAAVPLGAFAGDWFEAAGPEEQDLPAFLESADIERKRNRIRRRGGPDGRLGHQVSIDGTDIVVRNLGEMVIWERGKKVRTVLCDAFMHCTNKCSLRPCANAGLRIWRDVGRVDHAEWGLHGIATGEHQSA